MKTIKGTQTEKNLMNSFAGESQARMRYTYFASVAKKEGYEQIAAIFTETAKAMNKLLLSLQKLLTRKRNMQNVCSNIWKVECVKSQHLFLPV